MRFGVRIFAAIACMAGIGVAQQHRVRSLEIQVLSTMLADTAGVGEWGFSALVTADGRRILFDTGARPETVLNNARELKVDLSGVPEVILTHHHGDHTGGLLTLRRALRNTNAAALGTAHAGEGIFLERNLSVPGWAGMDRVRTSYEELGGKVIVHSKPVEIHPGVWLTGPVARVHPERNFGIGPGAKIRMPDGSTREDTIPEDMSMVIDTDRGLVVLSGCGHAGAVNTVEYARTKVRNAPLFALIGGLHLFQLDDQGLSWTARKLKEFGMQNFLGAHCTGIEATYRIRELCGLSRKTAAVAAVGGGFTLAGGISPGAISK